MKRTLVIPDLTLFPSHYRALFKDAAVYDSSSSKDARVWLIDRENGFYLKRAPKGSLEKEAALTQFFHQKRLAAEVLDYHRDQEADWLLTTRVSGEDATHPAYLADPQRLCDCYAEILRGLHDACTEACPVPNRLPSYFAWAEHNYRAGAYDLSYIKPYRGTVTAEEAWRIVSQNRELLQADTLIHGDYCLPNVMLDQWKPSGLIDLGNGGVGDRHIDLYWGAWSLCCNLGTDQYRQRFFDAYGRERIEKEKLLTVAAAEVFG